jgi:hypothetical protein
VSSREGDRHVGDRRLRQVEGECKFAQNGWMGSVTTRQRLDDWGEEGGGEENIPGRSVSNCKDLVSFQNWVSRTRARGCVGEETRE